MSSHAPQPSDTLKAPTDKHIAVIATRWNDKILSRLIDGCLARLDELGTPRDNYRLYRVPGAFELPVAALVALETHRYDAVICLGCVIRGDTWHFEAVAGECARGVRQVSLKTRRPVIFGVLTVENEQQALDRTGGSHGHAGRAAADAAVEMLHLLTDLNHRPAAYYRPLTDKEIEDLGDHDIPF